MSRQTEYVRKCPGKIQGRIERAQGLRFYVLQELGPLCFIISDDSDNSRKFKISIGSMHSCSCKKSFCVHIIWVMLKVFHLPPTSEILFQTSLVDREIEEILSSRKKRVSIDVKEPIETIPKGPEEKEDQVSPRPIQDGDVCPICQDELKNDPTSRTIHCYQSCGNNVHIKCLRILINHQKSIGKDTISCPLCRNDFGKIEEVNMRIDKQPKAVNTHLHAKHHCHDCHDTPRGNLYRCTMCKDIHLCHDCFIKGSHPEHSFEFIAKSYGKWTPAHRVVESILPSQLVQDLQNRELTDQDYNLLLQLDSRQEQGTTPLHIVNSFPVKKLCSGRDCLEMRLDEQRVCTVCVKQISYGELVRRIPCGHGFHQHCIDKWLLHQRSTCPTCGCAAYTCLDDGEDGTLMPNEPKYKATLPQYQSKKKNKKERRTKKKQVVDTKPESLLVIMGQSSSFPATPHTSSSSATTRASTKLVRMPIRLPPLPAAVPKAAEPTLTTGVPLEQSPAHSKKVSSQWGRKTFGLPPMKPTVRPTQHLVTDMCIIGHNK